MAYIITSKRGKRFTENYLRPGGLYECEKNGILKSTAMQDIAEMTSDMHPDARREIVNEFIDREKAK